MFVSFSDCLYDLFEFGCLFAGLFILGGDVGWIAENQGRLKADTVQNRSAYWLDWEVVVVIVFAGESARLRIYVGCDRDYGFLFELSHPIVNMRQQYPCTTAHFCNNLVLSNTTTFSLLIEY